MKRSFRSLSLLSAVVGLALFVGLLYQTGLDTLVDKIRLLGLGFLFLILYSGTRHYLRTVAWWLCQKGPERRLGLLDLFRIRLVGEAFNDMSPAGPILGDTVKVLATAKHTSAESGAASIVIESLIYSLSVILFLVCGVVLLLGMAMPESGRVVAVGLIIGLIVSILVPYWIISRRSLLLGRILDRLKDSGFGWDFLGRHEHRIRAFESSVHDFFWGHRKLFFFVLSIELVTNLMGIGEAYWILRATGTQVTILNAYLVESANRVAQLICAFVPFGLGVEEGAAAAALRALGYLASEGVSLGIIRKIRTVFWIATGLVLATRYVVPKPKTLEIWEVST
jgi:lysylphosphatidylglycerol synthase-like protein